MECEGMTDYEGCCQPLIVLTETEARITATIMEQITLGNDASGFAEEAQIVLDGLKKNTEVSTGEGTQ